MFLLNKSCFFAFWPFFVNQRSLSPKPLINHRCQWWATKPFIQWQWLDWKKTLEKPLIPMVEIWKTIEKPLAPMVHMWKNHWKIIDYNGTLTKTINHSIVVKILPFFSIIYLTWFLSWCHKSCAFLASAQRANRNFEMTKEKTKLESSGLAFGGHPCSGHTAGHWILFSPQEST